MQRQLISGTVYSLAAFEYDLDMWKVDKDGIQSTKQPVSDEAGPTSGAGVSSGAQPAAQEEEAEDKAEEEEAEDKAEQAEEQA